MAITKVYLTQYSASVDDSPVLLLGTKDSYGNEQLQIIRSPEWEDLIITVTFAAGDTPLASPVLVPEDGLIDVPAGATAERLPLEACGVITFCGVAAGVQRISTSLPYLVSDHGPVEGTVPAPTPSEWEQFVAQVKSDADWAKKGAADAEDAASDAKKALESTGAAVEDAKNAAAAAAQSAKEAAAESGKVKESAKSAVSDIDAAKKAALTDIDSAKNSAVSEVNDAGAAQTKAVASAGSAALASIGSAQQTTVQAVQQAGTAEAEKVNSAGAAQTKAVQDEGAGQVQAVTESGNTQAQRLTALVPEVYTKVEADGRYAPIGAAIKVSGKGTGLVSLSPTVAWGMLGLKLYGRSTQEDMPSPENSVQIESAGQNEIIDATVVGSNVFEVEEASIQDSGLTISIKDSVVEVGGTPTKNVDFYIFGNSSPETKRTYPKGALASFQNNMQNPASVQLIIRTSTNGTLFGIDQLNNALGKGPVEIYGVFFRFLYASYTGGGTLWFGIGYGSNLPSKPVVPQLLPIQTTNGLSGIAVDSGGNWTDEIGQQWLSDVVDFEAGTKTQYVFQEELELKYSSQYARYEGVVSNEIKAGSLLCLCDKGVYKITPTNSGECRVVPNSQQFILKSDVEVDSCTVLYVLADPIITPLTDDELAAYAALTTYPGTTNIIAPDCGIEASAVGDATQIITNITDKIAVLESSATGI